MRNTVKRASRLAFSRPVPTALDENIARVRNVSRTGCLINAHIWMKVDQVQHDLSILPPDGEPIDLSGQIVRARMVPGENGIVYEVGFKFDRDDPRFADFEAWFTELLINTEGQF